MSEAGTITDFKEDIAFYKAEFFQGTRGWLDELVQQFISGGGSRHLVIIGEPGVGKSAYIAHLADTYNCPRYFTRPRQELEVHIVGADARHFLVSVGHQLGQKYGAEIFGEGVVIEGEVDVRRASDRADAAGVFIDEAHLSPFRQLLIRGLVRSDEAGGESQLAGVRIKHLIDSAYKMPPQALIHEALLDPLSKIRDLYPDEMVVLLVDGLDVSLQQTEAKLVDLIPAAENLRAVMTSRPGQHLSGFRSRDKIALSETGDVEVDALSQSHLDCNRADARAYVANVVNNDPDIAPAVLRARVSSRRYTDTVAERCDGNFLYLRHFFTSLREDLRAGRVSDFLRVGGVPTGLHDFYRAILIRRIRGDLGDEVWENTYMPVLGVLAVAREPLPVERLAEFSSVAVRPLRGVLRRIEQFRDEVPTPEGWAYRFYHSSFAEYLLNTKINRDYPLDASEWDAAIVQHYRGDVAGWETIDWTNVDDYGLRHIGQHVAALADAPSYRQELYRLLSRPFMREKRSRYGSFVPFASDVSSAIGLASRREPPELVELTRASLLYARLGSLAGNIPVAALGALVRIGEVAQAREYADLRESPGDRVTALLAIAEAFVDEDRADAAAPYLEEALGVVSQLRNEEAGEASHALSLALMLSGSIEQAATRGDLADQERGRRNALLSGVALGFARARMAARALEIVDSMEVDDFRDGAVLAVVQALASGGDKTGALQAAEKFVPEGWLRGTEDPTDDQVLAAAATALATAGKTDDALAVAESLEDGLLRVRTIAAVASFLDQREMTATADALSSLASDALDPAVRAFLLADAAALRVKLDQTHRAVEVAEQAARAAADVGDPSLRANCLAAVAAIGARAGAEALMVDACKQALASAKEVAEPRERMLTLLAVGVAFAEAEAFDFVRCVLLAMGDPEDNDHSDGPSNEATETNEVAALLSKFMQGDRGVAVKQTQRQALGTLAAALARKGSPELSVEAADVLSDQQSRDDVLANVVAGLGSIGKADAALEVSELIRDAWTRISAVAQVAYSLSGVEEEKERARQLTNAVVDSLETLAEESTLRRDAALSVFVKWFAHLERFERARVAAEMIGDEGARWRAVIDVAQAEASAGAHQRAKDSAEIVVRIIEGYESDFWRASAASHAAELLARSGQVDAALRAADLVPTSAVDERSGMLRRLAPALADLGCKEASTRLLEELVQLVRHGSSNAELDLLHAVEAIAESGEGQWSREIADRITDDWYHISALATIASELARAGKLSGAKSAARDALDRAGALEPGLNQVSLLEKVATALLQIGDETAARQAAHEAAAAAISLPEQGAYRGAALREAALALANVGEFDPSLATAAEISTATDKGKAVADLGRTLARAGQHEQAKRLGREALKIAPHCWGNEQIEVLTAAAEILVEASSPEDVLASLKRVVQGDQLLRPLYAAIEHLIEIGHIDAALALIDAPAEENDGEVILPPDRRASFLAAAASRASEDRPELASRVLCNALVGAAHAGVGTVWAVLERGAAVLARLDDGESLWQVYEHAVELDRWWATA